MSRAARACAALIALCTCGAAPPLLRAADAPWPQWRGPGRDGIARTFTPPATWPDRLVRGWSVPVGIGYATPLLVDGRLFVFTRQQGAEVMLALDAGTGATVWRTAYPAPVTLNQRSGSFRHGEGPKSTPTWADGRIFAMGMGGIVSAFDAATGRLLWQQAPPPVLPLYGTATSPLVDGDLVIVHTGGHNQGALVAFDVRTGTERWRWAGDGPAYGSPVLATFDGVKQIVGVSQQFVIGVEAETGLLLWKRPFLPPNTTSSQTPIVVGRTVLISGQSMGVTAFAPGRRGGQWDTETLWVNEDVSMYMSNGVVLDGALHGLSHKNSGQWFAVDTTTGKTLWMSRGREAANAAIVAAGAFLVQLKDDGELLFTPPSRQGHAPAHRYQVADSQTWAQPVLDGRRIFIKDEDHLTLWTLP
ncbi:MAG: PQQ-binding-like beta-propeller repeat protein [Vicinamibacterales bacterium]